MPESETSKHIAIPDGLTATPGRMTVLLTLIGAEQPRRAIDAHGDPVYAMEPLAIVNLGTIPVCVMANGVVWTPAQTDLTDSGRFLLSALIDNAPSAIGRVMLMCQPYVQRDPADEVLRAWPTQNKWIN